MPEGGIRARQRFMKILSRCRSRSAGLVAWAISIISSAVVCCAVQAADSNDKDEDGSGGEDGFFSIFTGNDLSGWKDSGEVADCFSVNDAGEMVVAGGRAHLFYVGDDDDGAASFGDFELKLKGKSTKGSNSGVYFHTEFQGECWPDLG